MAAKTANGFAPCVAQNAPNKTKPPASAPTEIDNPSRPARHRKPVGKAPCPALASASTGTTLTSCNGDMDAAQVADQFIRARISTFSAANNAFDKPAHRFQLDILLL